MFRKKIKRKTHYSLQISAFIFLAALWIIPSVINHSTAILTPTVDSKSTKTDTVRTNLLKFKEDEDHKLSNRRTTVITPPSAPTTVPTPISILDTILTYSKSIGTIALIVVQITIGIQQYRIRKRG